MNQQTNKLVLVKRLKGWLALMMAVTMLFGSSMIDKKDLHAAING